jgi:DNA-binding transcriptional ArsR family regulator
MITGPIIAEIAALVGDPARATMVSTLLDGRGLTASELALAARVTPQTASSHLAKLTQRACCRWSVAGGIAISDLPRRQWPP